MYVIWYDLQRCLYINVWNVTSTSSSDLPCHFINGATGLFYIMICKGKCALMFDLSHVMTCLPMSTSSLKLLILEDASSIAHKDVRFLFLLFYVKFHTIWISRSLPLRRWAFVLILKQIEPYRVPLVRRQEQTVYCTIHCYQSTWNTIRAATKLYIKAAGAFNPLKIIPRRMQKKPCGLWCICYAKHYATPNVNVWDRKQLKAFTGECKTATNYSATPICYTHFFHARLMQRLWDSRSTYWRSDWVENVEKGFPWNSQSHGSDTI